MLLFTGSFEAIRNAKYFFFARRSTIKLGVKQVRVFARACASFPIASLIFKFPGTSRFSLSLCSFFSTLALPTSGSQLRKSVQTRLRFSSVIKERAARRIAAKPSSSPSLPYPLSLSTVIRHLTSQLGEFTFLIDRLSSLSLLQSSLRRQSAAQTNSAE